MIHVAVLISPGFEEIEAITPIDILRRAGIRVSTLGLNNTSITGAHSITLACDAELSGFKEELDGVIIPGGMPGALNISQSESAMTLINSLFTKGKLIAAICASPGVVLGGTSILQSRSFTCYPGFEDRVPKGHFTEKRVVLSDNVITSRGPGSAMEFSLAIIDYFLDSSESNTISKALLFPRIS